MCFKNPRGLPLACCVGIAALFASAETDQSQLTDTWIVKTANAPISNSTLMEWKANDRGPLGSLKGFYKIDFSQSELSATEIDALLEKQDGVLWFEREIRDQYQKSKAIIGTPTDDPSFGQAWHITNAGLKNGKKGEDLNLLPTWDWGLDGTGNLIVVIDTGVEMDHPDLEANIRQDLALDKIGTRTTLDDSDTDRSHGTAVAGIIAADDNDIGAVGIAYGAHLIPIRYIGVSHSDAESAEVLSHLNRMVSIYNNSWGPVVGDPDENLVGMTGSSTLGRMAIAEGVEDGRGGLGSIYVFSGGNDAEAGSNVNYNSWANNRHTIAVAAIGNGGKHASYSEPGAPLLVSAPSGGQSLGIYTTDRTGINGYNTTEDYTSGFSGTSAAAPMVSGVVALMLQANPLLTWRDVQHVLAKTAIKVDSEDEGWKLNAAGLPFNDKYGFGRVDSSAAIQAALAWENVGPEISSTISRSPNQSIPINGTPMETSVTLSKDMRIEHVVATPTINHTNWGDLRITLISPSGTESLLAEPHTDAIGNYTSWNYSSVQFWDESSQGTWTLRIEDLGDEGFGSLTRWSLRVYGSELDDERNLDPIAAADQYVTTEFPATLPVLSNDSEPDGDSLFIVSLYQPEFGELEIDENENLVYTPDEESFLGIDQFGYTLSDGKGGSSDTLVNITHPGPVAISDQAVVVESGTVSIPVLLNDFDRSEDAIALVSVETPENGTTAIEEDGVRYSPDSGFIGFEDFSYTITDNNHGEKSGKIRVFTSGDPDFAMLFDGVNDYVKFEHNDAFNISTTITIEASFYLRSYGENGNVGFGRIIDRDTYSLLVNGEEHTKYPDHSMVFAIELPSGATAVANTAENTIQLNRWYKVAVTYDGSSVKFYIDGQQVKTHFDFTDDEGNVLTPFIGPIATKEAELYIGENAAGTRGFDGIIDWERIWNKVLTPTQVSNYDLFIDESERGGLVGWFQFNEGFGWETLESIGNGGMGTIHEALWVPKDPSMLSAAIAVSESQ